MEAALTRQFKFLFVCMIHMLKAEQLQFLSAQPLALSYVSLASRIVGDYKLKRTFSYHVSVSEDFESMGYFVCKW